MENYRDTETTAEADVRRALGEYQAIRRRVQAIDRHEPGPDEPERAHQQFDLQAKATFLAERMARDALANVVAKFAGTAPCAVIVDSRGGSSVVALSGKPDGMIVAPAADRVPIKSFLCRPEPPPEFAHQFRQMAPNQAGVYLVMQRGDVVAIYNGVYFRSTNEVVADLQELIRAGLEGIWSDDFVIWCDGRIMAVIHQPIEGEQQKLFLFNETRNYPIAGRVLDPMPFWPTYEEWLVSGRGELWKTEPEN
jgi:hypothetical protein